MPLKWLAGGAFLAALRFLTIPSTPRFDLCGFHCLTGKPCPLCGLTRALFALGKGQWQAAIHFNALSPLGFVMLFSLFWGDRYRSRLWMTGVAAFGLYGLFRIFT